MSTPLARTTATPARPAPTTSARKLGILDMTYSQHVSLARNTLCFCLSFVFRAPRSVEEARAKAFGALYQFATESGLMPAQESEPEELEERIAMTAYEAEDDDELSFDQVGGVDWEQSSFWPFHLAALFSSSYN